MGRTGGGVGVERDCVTFSLVPAAVLRLEFRQITYELMSPKVEKTTFVSFYKVFFQTKSRWKSTVVAKNADVYLLNEYNNERTHYTKVRSIVSQHVSLR